MAIIRLSGAGVIELTNQVFRGRDLTQQASHTVHFGTIYDQEKILDEVLVSIFRTPKSFTREDTVEISCHGSDFIVQRIIQLLILRGARLAKPGEFTLRAFLNGKLDLAQAEAVADLIAADSSAAHRTALQQMRGGFSSKIEQLRGKLVHFASMLELELDFSEEDVAFADREALKELVQELLLPIVQLIQSFSLGNVIKNGITTVIAGKPNVGKSTLLNALLNEERAIVSDIPGTTRDLIEAELNIEGVHFRFIDTAGLRSKAADTIEAIGIAKTKKQLQKAAVIIYLFDLATETLSNIRKTVQQLDSSTVPYVKVGNKMDIASPDLLEILQREDFVLISAAQQQNVPILKSRLLAYVALDQLPKTDTIVVNARHHESLTKSKEALEDVLQGITSNLTHELLAQDVRRALYHLGGITGEVITEELLDNIFSKFCIGK
ncbi:MAG: tRNA uridine-5-carboxymethylaminomethyl(34) synthesis GTPase MnmE [Amoebophilaceae bacterium]|jgi:tRNA modification GTPase|nr:tRNA uridine-5-carboxymethylaminomethyl(34) synthesis GTPase MnmE [Amoebophilaceae bacterium]